MPGMNPNSRSIRLIETYLAELEGNVNASPADAMLVLDEIRRLERKWNEQVAAGSSRRIESDFKAMAGWYRRWLLATARLTAAEPGEPLRAARRDVEQSLAK